MKLTFAVSILGFCLAMPTALYAVTAGVQSTANVYGNLLLEPTNQITNVIGLTSGVSSAPPPGMFGLSYQTTALAGSVSNQAGYVNMHANGTTSAFMTASSQVRTTALFSPTLLGGNPGDTFPAALNVSLDGDFLHTLTNSGNIAQYANLSVSLSYQVQVITPNWQESNTGGSAAYYSTTATYGWNGGGFALTNAPLNKAYFYSGAAVEAPGGFFPSELHTLTDSGMAIPNGYHLDMAGPVPFTAVVGQDYFLETQLSLTVMHTGLTLGTSVGMAPPSNDFLYGLVADFTHTSETSLSGSGGGAFTLVAVPEPTTLSCLAGLLLFGGLRRRSI
jgi:hypothetical protein